MNRGALKVEMCNDGDRQSRFQIRRMEWNAGYVNTRIITCCLLVGLLVECHPFHEAGSDVRRLPLHPATIPTPQSSQMWLARVKELDEMSNRERIRVVFLGDSITQGWESDGRRIWEQYYSNRVAANLTLL